MSCQKCGIPCFGPVCARCKGEMWSDGPSGGHLIPTRRAYLALGEEEPDLAPVNDVQPTMEWLKEASEEEGCHLDPEEVYEAVVELLAERDQMLRDLWDVVKLVPTTQTRCAPGTDRLEMRCLGCDKLVNQCRSTESNCWAKLAVKVQLDWAARMPE